MKTNEEELISSCIFTQVCMKLNRVGTWILFLFICLFIAVPAATASDERPIPSVRADCEVWAVIVGISDFRFVNDLSYCDDDARDLTTYLQNDCAIPADHIVTLIDSQASKNAIQSKIAELQSKSGTDDIVVVSFSSHGTYGSDLSPYDESDGYDEYIIAWDTRYLSGAIRDDELKAWLDAVPSKNTLLIVDTCFSGGMTKDTGSRFLSLPDTTTTPPSTRDGLRQDFSRDLSDSRYTVLMACNDAELSGESSALQNGYFTYFLLEGLLSLSADTNANTYLSAEEGFFYAKPKVAAYSYNSQNPQIYDGDIAHQIELTLPQGTPAPTITGITPGSGVVGSSVTVTNLAGTNFQTGAAVELQNDGQVIAATDEVVVTTSQITCTIDIPSDAAVGSWNVVVTNPDTQYGILSNGFSVTSGGLPAPTVTAISPNTGAAGATVSITTLAGTSFQSGAAVELRKDGQVIAATSEGVVSDTQITCTIVLPSDATIGSWDVIVINPDTQSGTLAGGFTVTSGSTPAPTISRIQPSSGRLGTTVTVTNLAGTNFVTGAQVQLRKSGAPTIEATNEVVVSSLKITGKIPIPSTATKGVYDVVVINPDGKSGIKPSAFRIL